MTVRVRMGNKFAAERVKALADRAPAGWICEYRKETRSDEQNRKLWPMLEDIRKQVEGAEVFSRDDLKLRFLNALGTEMRFLPELEGPGSFPVGLRSSTLTKEQFSALIELIYEYGARHDVHWSEPERDAA